MIAGIFQPPVSRLTAAIVERHCGAKTNHANKESAVANDQLVEISGIKASAASALELDKAYTVAKELTTTSRAAIPGTSAILICQLNPIGEKTWDKACPNIPAILY